MSSTDSQYRYEACRMSSNNKDELDTHNRQEHL